MRQGGPVTTETAESPWRTTRERGPQRDAKRDAVVRAAAKLFTTRGFKGTSLDDIAASLGVTKPTLYHYVANKEEILFACVQRGLDALRAGSDNATCRVGIARALTEFDRSATQARTRRLADRWCPKKNGLAASLLTRCLCWSGRRDSNSRPLAPHASALPGCATPRVQGL